ncbi:hypothetical protein FRC08_008044 [Ceratobasidium sp. 394]|nr:hypothetical protein FRC08_008044 [Ceratobasidium sp. 394]
MDPNSVKALFRSACALNELCVPEHALECCDRALKLEPHSKPLEQQRKLARYNVIKLQQLILRSAYTYYHMYIVPTTGTGSIEVPTTHPHEMPFFDPPMPVIPVEVPMFCYVRFRYIERYASDTVSEFPTDKPLLPLLETFLPGTTTLPPSRSRNNLHFVSSDSEPNITHPTSWDPQHEFLPSTLSVYARTRRGEIIPIQDKMSLADMFAEVRRLAMGQHNDRAGHIELRRGMVHLFAFRRDSRTETRWKSGQFKDPANLGDPKYQVSVRVNNTTDLRARHFCYDNPNGRTTNLPTSLSWAAREGILDELYSTRGDEGRYSTD